MCQEPETWLKQLLKPISSPTHPTNTHRKMGALSKYSENFSASSVAEEMSSFSSGRKRAMSCDHAGCDGDEYAEGLDVWRGPYYVVVRVPI